MAFIKFLGTAGARFVVMKQLRYDGITDFMNSKERDTPRIWEVSLSYD